MCEAFLQVPLHWFSLIKQRKSPTESANTFALSISELTCGPALRPRIDPEFGNFSVETLWAASNRWRYFLYHTHCSKVRHFCTRCFACSSDIKSAKLKSSDVYLNPSAADRQVNPFQQSFLWTSTNCISRQIKSFQLSKWRDIWLWQKHRAEDALLKLKWLFLYR